MIGRPCSVCGAKTDGSGRCDLHKAQAGTKARPCAGCGARGAGEWCSACNPSTSSRARRARQPWRAGYDDPEYRDSRTAAIARADGVCEGCGLAHGGAFEVDHVTPLVDGGSNELDNLQVLGTRACDCHVRKTRADRARRARH